MNSNGIITAPINAKADVATVLGVSSTSVTTLCTSPNINKWAKYKPVAINNPTIRIKTDTINVTDPITSSLKQVPAYYGYVTQETVTVTTSSGNIPVNIVRLGGIAIPELVGRSTGDALSVISSYTSNNMNWSSSTIPSSYPKRLGDFDGYNHSSVSPFYFDAPETIYQDDYPIFYYSVSAATSDQWGLDDMKQYLSDKYQYAVVIRSTSGQTYEILGEYINGGLSTGSLVMNGPLSLGSYTAYFMAIDKTNNRILLMPNTAECKNPISFVVKSGSNPGSNPFTGIIITSVGFAYDYTYSYWEPFTNVQEGDYVTMNTTGKYAIKMTWQIRQNYAPAIQFSLMDFKWNNCGTGSNKNISGFRIFINGTEYTSSDTYVFQQNTTYNVIFELADVFTSEDGTNNTPPQGTQFSQDPIEMVYNGQTQYTESVDITYDPAHNGQFYNAVDGYYTSR